MKTFLVSWRLTFPSGLVEEGTREFKGYDKKDVRIHATEILRMEHKKEYGHDMGFNKKTFKITSIKEVK